VFGKADAEDYHLEGFELDQPPKSSTATDLLDTNPDGSPNMWSAGYIGLYAHYAGLGLMQGQMSVAKAFCAYVYDGPSNLCSNAGGLLYLAWNFKVRYPKGAGNPSWRDVD
jgi:hypothetical protein